MHTCQVETNPFQQEGKKPHNTKLIIKSVKFFTAQSNIKITPKYVT